MAALSALDVSWALSSPDSLTASSRYVVAATACERSELSMVWFSEAEGLAGFLSFSGIWYVWLRLPLGGGGDFPGLMPSMSRARSSIF
jgi:uncharacterized protein (DUF488 family)